MNTYIIAEKLNIETYDNLLVVDDRCCVIDNNPYTLTTHGLLDCNDEPAHTVLAYLLCGHYRITDNIVVTSKDYITNMLHCDDRPLIERVYELCGIAIGDTVTIKDKNGDDILYSPHKATADGIVDAQGDASLSAMTHLLLTGKYTVDKGE